MSNNETYNYRKRSLGDLPDPFNVGGYQGGNDRQQPFSTEASYISPQSSVYFAEQYSPAETMNPYLYSPRDDVIGNMVGMNSGLNSDNFIVFGGPNIENKIKVANNHNFVDQTNGNLSGLDYPTDYSGYNLFSSPGGGSPFDSATSSDAIHPPIHSTPHLIQNLVGQWGTGGNYTPFGSSVAGTGVNDFANDRSVRKPRMVAEVRPMRLSYSDVLAKSAPNQKQGKQEGKPKIPDIKNGKNCRSSVGRTLSGNSGLGNRQNSQGDEQPSKQQKFLNTLKKLINQPTSMKKKWVSLDDLNGGINGSDFLRDETTKKAPTKNQPSKKAKENWEPPHLSNGRTSAGKSPDANKKSNGNAGAVPKVQQITREKDVNAGSKGDSVKAKPTEERKASTQIKSPDSGKTARRNSKNVQADKDKKKVGSKGRRRDAGGWQAVIAHRVDLAMACVLRAATWLVTLVLDVFALSTHLFVYMCTAVWQSCMTNVSEKYANVTDYLRSMSFINWLSTSRFWPFRRAELPPPLSDDDGDDSDSGTDDAGDGKKKRKRLPGGLKHNLPLPSTGDEAMKRLLACKGKDPYSILGVSQDCTDDDIKKYYKRQAFLVHPDKNNQPGAEEAFKILVHAFDIIGEPEHRKSYDRNVEKTAQAEQAWSELSELLAQLHKKMEYVANTLRCTNCGKRHKRSIINRPIYAARMCSQCNIHHSAREGDIWAETSVFGLMWRYFACMDGSVYDISEWAACQGGNLKNLKANTHQVQYRIVLGKNEQKGRSHQSSNTSGEPDLEEFINNLYTKPESGSGGDGSGETRNRKHRRKK